MRIIEKIREKQANIGGSRQPCIAFLGDSVTQGCFEIYNDKGSVKTTFYPTEAYAEKVKAIFAELYPSVPMNVINAGISGDTSWGGLARLERDVLSYNPDLVVVCYGLNDAGRGENGIEKYDESLRAIFAKVKASGAEVIFLTPNLRINDPDYRCDDKVLENCRRGISENERAGWLDKYLDRARKAAVDCGVPVCDCNALWKVMSANGVDTNRLLSNVANHPTRDMHWVFAYELTKTMFEH